MAFEGKKECKRLSDLGRAIPKLKENESRGFPPICENGEPLRKVHNDHERIFSDSQYYKQNIKGSLPHIYVREGVWQKLLQVVAQLPEDYCLLLYDGYRPIEVQKHLFDEFYNELKKQNANLSHDELITETRKYVALPISDSERPTSHITGGAIDVTLATKDGMPIEMGTPFDFMEASSATAYFEKHENANEEARDNRRLLYNAMTLCGFTNYEEEWWHYDYGNQQHALLTGLANAIYGKATLLKEESED